MNFDDATRADRSVPLKDNPASVARIRAAVDWYILKDLGRVPGAMTRREYWRQGASFAALSAPLQAAQGWGR